ncbi:MAG: hypothetical protein H0U23_11770 [Blastocatellia bacterium]|nr:hypothetical protein [Blastocatellia bacterium]
MHTKSGITCATGKPRAHESASSLLMNRQPRPILDLYSPAEVQLLFSHLHNDNPPYRYVCGFRDRSSEPIYKNADKRRKLTASASIKWSIETMMGKSGRDKHHAYVPLPSNPSGHSRWGGLDFDAHEPGELTRASELAFKAFLHVVNEPYFTLLETNVTGWHLWLVSCDFHPVPWWLELLQSIVTAIGATPELGVVELYPSKLPDNYGFGLRAPGTWNPRTDSVNQIVYDGLRPFVDAIAGAERERSYLSSRETARVPNAKIGDVLKKFAITVPATRHKQLLGLVGRLHVMFCHEAARRIAKWQFENKTVDTEADLAQHLAEFEDMWRRKLIAWRETLSLREAQQFERLTTEPERDAFRIIRDFHRSATHSGGAEFFISRDSLADRIGISGQGAGKLCHRFCKLGIILPTLDYVPNRRCTYYKWTAA